MKFIGEKTMYLVIIVLLITTGALGWLLKSKTQTIVEKENQIVFLTDTLEVFKDKTGKSVAKIARLEASSTKDFLSIKNLIGDNKRLQEAVSLNKNILGTTGSVTVISNKTSIDTKNPSIISYRDTVRVLKSDTVIIYPEYASSFNLGKWVRGSTIANKDSTTVKAVVIGEYDLVLGEEPIPGTGFLGLWRKQKAFSMVTNLNPYSETTTLKTYSVKNTIKQKKLSLGVIGGYGFGFKSNNFQPFLGLGGTYKF